MAVTQIGNPSIASAAGSFSAVINYDDVAQTVSVIPSGSGHAKLKLYDNTVSPALELDAVWLDQFGATAGPIQPTETVVDGVGQEDAGRSATSVDYDGVSAVIVAGPGAQGIDVHAKPAPTRRVSGAIVGRLNPPKGVASSLAIELDWTA